MGLPESRKRLLCFDLAELPRDVFNMVDGPSYEPFIGVNDVKAHRSLTSEVTGIWSGRSHVLASLEELNVFFELEANPFIASIREGYPLFTPEVLHDLMDGNDVARNRVKTIDFVVTLPPRNMVGPLRYHGLNSKPDNIGARQSAQRRFAKEKRELEEVGWSWSRVRSPSKDRVRAVRTLREWAKAGAIDDAARDAAHLGAALYKTTSRKELGALLRMLGRRVGISERDQYFVFAAAFYFGFVGLEKNSPVDVNLPVALVQPARSPSKALLYV